jgi:hypothetical protein
MSWNSGEFVEISFRAAGAATQGSPIRKCKPESKRTKRMIDAEKETCKEERYYQSVPFLLACFRFSSWISLLCPCFPLVCLSLHMMPRISKQGQEKWPCRMGNNCGFLNRHGSFSSQTHWYGTFFVARNLKVKKDSRRGQLVKLLDACCYCWKMHLQLAYLWTVHRSICYRWAAFCCLVGSVSGWLGWAMSWIASGKWCSLVVSFFFVSSVLSGKSKIIWYGAQLRHHQTTLDHEECRE